MNSSNIRDALDCTNDVHLDSSFAGLFYIVSRIYAVPEEKLPAKAKVVLVDTAYALFSIGLLKYVKKPEDVDFFKLL
jgi:hypothetical protein